MKMPFDFRVNDQLIFFITRKLGTQRDEIPKKVEPTGFFFLNFYNFVSHHLILHSFLKFLYTSNVVQCHEVAYK